MTSNNQDIAVVLLAAGRSSRFGGDRSKLLSEIDGRRVIDLTLERILEALPLAEIILVSNEELRDEIGFSGSWTLGGRLRQQSAAAGVAKSGEAGVVLIHDAARPFVSRTLIERLLAALSEFDAVAPAVAVTDTVKLLEGRKVIETLPRGRLARMQTPQAIRGSLARDFFSRLDSAEEFTDDLAVVESMGGNTGVVDGEADNIKITTAADLVAAREILARRISNQVGSLKV